MRSRVPFRAVPALRCLSLAALGAAAAGLFGCGGGITRGAVALPADAVYSSAVRAAGYTITDLGPGRAVAINNRGAVLGSAAYAFLWTGGTRHYLGVFGTDKGGNEAISLNDRGQALGYSFSEPRTPESAARRRAFVWQSDAFTPVSVAAESEDTDITAIKINAAGQVLLSKNSYPNPEFLLWKDGLSTPVVAVGKTGTPLTLFSLSDSGALLGGASDSPEPFQETPVPSRTYLVKNGLVIDVGFLPDRLNTVPGFINDREQIVGVGFTNDPIGSDAEPQNYVWQNGAIAALTDLGTRFLINGLSNQGQIVGYASDPSTGDRTAFRYDLNTRTRVDLQATVGKAAGWRLNSADAINDAGQIVGDGEHDGQQRIFLLTPLP